MVNQIGIETAKALIGEECDNALSQRGVAWCEIEQAKLVNRVYSVMMIRNPGIRKRASRTQRLTQTVRLAAAGIIEDLLTADEKKGLGSNQAPALAAVVVGAEASTGLLEGVPDWETLLPQIKGRLGLPGFMPPEREPRSYQDLKARKLLDTVPLVLAQDGKYMAEDITPPSGGKGQIKLMLAKAATECGLRVLVITSGRNVIDGKDGLKSTFEHGFDDTDIGVYHADLKQPGRLLTMSTHASIKMPEAREAIFDTKHGPPPSVILVDECDLFKTELSFKSLDLITEKIGFKPLIAGLTGTEPNPERGSIISDEMFLDELVRLRGAKHILGFYNGVPVDITAQDTWQNGQTWALRKNSEGAKRFRSAAIAEQLKVYERFHLGESSLFITPFVEDAKLIGGTLDTMDGVEVEVLTGERTNEVGDVLNDYMGDEGANTLSVTRVFGRGSSDAGKTENLFLPFISGSHRFVLQALGRGLRYHELNRFLRVYQPVPNSMVGVGRPVLLEDIIPEGVLHTPDFEDETTLFDDPQSVEQHIEALLAANPHTPLIGGMGFQIRPSEFSPSSRSGNGHSEAKPEKPTPESAFLSPADVRAIVDTRKMFAAERLVHQHFSEIFKAFLGKFGCGVEGFKVGTDEDTVYLAHAKTEEKSITSPVFARTVLTHCLRRRKMKARRDDVVGMHTAGIRLAKIWYSSGAMPDAHVVEKVVATQHENNYLRKVLPYVFKELLDGLLESENLSLDDLTVSNPPRNTKLQGSYMEEPLELTYLRFLCAFLAELVDIDGSKLAGHVDIALKYLKQAYHDGYDSLDKAVIKAELEATQSSTASLADIDTLVSDDFMNLAEAFTTFGSLATIPAETGNREIVFEGKIIGWGPFLRSCFVALTGQERKAFADGNKIGTRALVALWHRTEEKPDKATVDQYLDDAQIAKKPLAERREKATEVLAAAGIKDRLDFLFLSKQRFTTLDFGPFQTPGMLFSLIGGDLKGKAYREKYLDQVPDLLGLEKTTYPAFRAKVKSMLCTHSIRNHNQLRSRPFSQFKELKFGDFNGDYLYQLMWRVRGTEGTKRLRAQSGMQELANFIFV